MKILILFQLCLAMLSQSSSLSITRNKNTYNIQSDENGVEKETILTNPTEENKWIHKDKLTGEIHYTGSIYNADDVKELIERDQKKVEAILTNIKQNVDSNDEYDWRKVHNITKVKNQGGCGSCWAFATVSVLETSFYMQYKRFVNLSESELVECDKKDGGCNGGSYEDVEVFLTEEGIESEEFYPYENGNGDVKQCKGTMKNVILYLDKFVFFNGTYIEKILQKRGPVGVYINANLMSNTYEIIRQNVTTCNPDEIDHAVVIVGFGTENNIPYWIVRNSWGAEWGKDGYFRIERGSNACGIENFGMTADVSDY